jgi:AbrB family looped-hinge helix DNA binding protein
MTQRLAKLSTKGQLVIPAKVREELGIEPGTQFAIHQLNGRLILDPQNLAAKLSRIKSMRGIAAEAPSLSDELIQERRRERERELREEGW